MMGRTDRNLDFLIEAGVIGLLVFAPLPFGAVVPWAQAAVEGIVALLLSLCVVQMLSRGELKVRRTPLVWPAITMAAVVGVQFLLPIWGSVNPHATWSSLRLYLAYFGLLLVLTHYLVTQARIVRLLSILICWGALLAVLGLAGQMLGWTMIPWVAPSGRLTTTFVNPNHQALYFSVLLFFALGLLLRPGRPSRVRSARAAGSREDRETRQIGSLSGRVLLVGAMLLIGGALVLTMSRGGLVGALMGLFVVFAVSLHGRAGSWTLVAVTVVSAIVILYASWFGLDPVLERFSDLAKDPFGDLRWAVWEATLRMAGEAPVLGVGLGAFQDAFPLYRPRAVPLRNLVDYAHNDYLQLLAEVGVVGLVVAAWALVRLLAFVLRRWAVRHDPFVRGLTMGGLGALAAVAAQSMMDFGLHMPANALLVVLLVALLPVVVTLRRSLSGDRVDLRDWSWQLAVRTTRNARVAVVGVAILLVGLLVAPPGIADWHLGRATRAAGETARAEGRVTTGDLVKAYGELEYAARLDPWNPAVQHTLAGVAEEIALRIWSYGVGPDGQRLRAPRDERLESSHRFFAVAYGAYQRSLLLSPRTAQTHDRLGWFLGNLEMVRQTVKGSAILSGSMDPRLRLLLTSDESLYPRALAQLRKGISWDPKNAYRHQSLGLFALFHLKDSAGRQVVVDGFRQALSLQPALLDDVLDSLSSSASPDHGLLEAAMPSRYDLWLVLARRSDRQGGVDAATAAFEKALALAPDPTAQVEVRLAYGEALLRGGNAVTALAQARHALVLAPKNPEVFALLSTAYEAMQKWDEAESTLVSAVALAGGGDPKQANGYRGRLASYFTRRGQDAPALLLRRQILEGAPNDAWAHFEVGKLFEQRREWPDAFHEYRAAEGLGFNDWNLLRNVARAYARQGLLREAIAAYEAAVRLHPNDNDLRMEVAELHTRAGSTEQAIEQYRRVLARQPNHATAGRALGSATGPSVRKTGP